MGYPENSLHYTNTLSHLSVVPPQTKHPHSSIHPYSSSHAIQCRPRQQSSHILSTILSWNIRLLGHGEETFVSWVNEPIKLCPIFLWSLPLSIPTWNFNFSKTSCGYFYFTYILGALQINGLLCMALIQSSKKGCMYKLGKKCKRVSSLPSSYRQCVCIKHVIAACSMYIIQVWVRAIVWKVYFISSSIN